jgi:hypothetical protein
MFKRGPLRSRLGKIQRNQQNTLFGKKRSCERGAMPIGMIPYSLSSLYKPYLVASMENAENTRVKSFTLRRYSGSVQGAHKALVVLSKG